MTELESLLHDLVATNSVNPSLSTEGAGETKLATLVRDWCEAQGLQTHWLEPAEGRPSVVAVAAGTGGGRSLMLNAHLDTVGTAGMTRPFEPSLQGGRLYGRGALDMKAGLAACMAAVAQARELSLRGDVILTAVADEEHASLGTTAVLERFGADAALVTEPTNLELHIAHRGFAVFEIETHGKTSHTSQPHLGVNAIHLMGRVLLEIEALNSRLQRRDPHPLLGCGSAQAVLVRGGQELFTTPDYCRVSFERRTLPGESPHVLQREVSGLLQQAGSNDERFEATSRLVIHREPFEVSPDEVIVQLVHDAVTQRLGRAPEHKGAPYWMDAALLAGVGIPTVVFGPAGEGMHATEEWVELGSVRTLSEVLLDVIEAYCA